jgi:uroporphyrinogen decarboxylase
MDYEVDPRDAARILPRTCLDGNIRPLSFVLGAPDEISAECRRLATLFEARGGFILSSGCEIPLEAKPANVAAMVAAVRGGS